MAESPYAVEMRDIVVRFPGVLANDHVNFTLRRRAKSTRYSGKTGRVKAR
jgi:ABC-type sugar transport system ATPase subunit